MMVNDQIRMLEIHSTGTMGNLTVIHPCLLLGDSEIWLVDAGFPGQAEVILDAIRAEGIDPQQISGLLITHQDIDHIGSAGALRKFMPNAKVYCHPFDRPYIQGNQKPLKLAGFEKVMEGKPEEQRQFLYKLTRGFEQSYLPVDEEVGDGQVLPLAGGTTVIHAPGHTPGHINLYVQDCQLLIAADSLRVTDGELSLMVDDNHDDPVQFRQSIQKLNGYPIGQVISYHGGYYRGDVNQRLTTLLKNA
jgi:glyoxylase-like metal-dependent hydrolase (beta-lactamase superfamily II)